MAEAARRLEPEEQEDSERAPRPFWSGTITFGLVSIPVALYPANRSSRIRLRMLGPNGKPLRRRYFSETSGRELNDDQMIRGYEVSKGKYVEISDEELERVAPEKTRDIDLRRFVLVDSIPPLFFEHAYFLVPAGGSMRAYKLLAATMEETGRAGIATFVMRGKEYLVAILAENGILRGETLRFADELRTPADIGLPDAKKPQGALVKGVEAYITRHSANDISRAEMRDPSIDKLQKLLAKKKPRKVEKQSEVIDLLSVLQQSLSKRRAA